MKVVLLCGGRGTRISEETIVKPKPMVTIGENPILFHIMSLYSHFGFNDFQLALGYKAEIIKEYFLNFYALNNDFRVNLENGSIDYLKKNKLNWKVSLFDTGLDTMTGGRLLRLKSVLSEEPFFMLTYGDGVANLNIRKLVDFHLSHGKLATITAVRPPSRFGEILIDDQNQRVFNFKEKPQAGEGWINGGFFVFSPKIFDYLTHGDQTILERDPLEKLSQEDQLMAFKHDGFWQCMDSMRDKLYLEKLVEEKKAPWTFPL